MQLRDEDAPYLWAAYKKGVFSDPLFVEDMTPEEFNYALGNWLRRYSGIFIVSGPSEGRILPLLMIPVSYFDDFTSVARELVYMPWATPRNRIEATVRFFNDFRKSIKGLYVAKDDENERFLTHICKYGILRGVGKIHNYGPLKQRLMMFETN